MWVRSELDERLSRRSEPEVREGLLRTTDDLTKRVGHGKDQVEVWDRQELLRPLFQPHLGLMAVAFGATTVAAGVVDILFLTPVITLEQVPSQDLRATCERCSRQPSSPSARTTSTGGAPLR